MNYIRIDYKGSIQPIKDEELIGYVCDDIGHVLIVTGQRESSIDLHEELQWRLQPSESSPRELTLRLQNSSVKIRTNFDWPDYMGLQLTSAYIHRDASIDFMLKIMSKCRYVPR